MPQMNNIALASSTKMSANAGSVLPQDTSSEDFSSALASASSQADPSAKPASPQENTVKQDNAVKSNKDEASEEAGDDETDIGLIFAQIGMANEMKKAAEKGEGLPLELNGEAKESGLPADILQEDGELASELLNVTLPEQTAPVLESAAQAGELTDSSGSMFQSLMAEQAALAAKERQALTADKSAQASLSVTETGSKEALSNGLGLSATLTDTAIVGQTSAVDGVNAADNMNILGSLGEDMPALDEVSQAEVNAGLLLKDAKLAVSLENASDSSNLASGDADIELKPMEFKPMSNPSAFATQQLTEQDVQQVKLSLRQGLETQNQMQEMIQRFSPVMKQQLVTMVSQGIQQAEIRLDPPELGHMLVKVQVNGEQTQVQFHVTQSQTRDVVEQAIPRLRELLQEQGMQLTDSQVSQGDQGQRREGGFAEGNGTSAANVDDFSAEESDLGLNQATSLNSGIDYYA